MAHNIRTCRLGSSTSRARCSGVALRFSASHFRTNGSPMGDDRVDEVVGQGLVGDAVADRRGGVAEDAQEDVRRCRWIVADALDDRGGLHLSPSETPDGQGAQM
jgi:hypothetical protein